MLYKFTRNSRNLFIVGAVLALVAFGLVFSILSRATAPGTLASRVPVQSPKPVQVPGLIARTTVPAFTQITDPHAAVQQYFTYGPVKPGTPDDYVKGEAALAGLIAQGPRHLAFSLAKGQPLLASELLTNTAPGAVDYASLLQKGEVAETVSVPALSSVNGNIQPSDHVNLLLSVKLQLTLKDLLTNKYHFVTFTDDNLDPTQKSSLYKHVAYIYESQTTMENLRVLAVSGNNYTLALTNQEALLLKWIKDSVAGSTGNGYSVDLVVRSSSDTDGTGKYFTTNSITPDTLLESKYTHANKWLLP